MNRREALTTLAVLMPAVTNAAGGMPVKQDEKSDPATSAIPVIALTAHALPTDRQMAADVGCDGYLAKPVEPHRVLAEVKRFLGD